MAEAPRPTNGQIVELLEQVLSELRDVKDGQQQLAADLSTLAESAAR